jgi:hypothetical protein
MFAWATRQAANPDEYRRTIERLREDFQTVHREEVLLEDGRVLDRYSARSSPAPCATRDREFPPTAWASCSSRFRGGGRSAPG